MCTGLALTTAPEACVFEVSVLEGVPSLALKDVPSLAFEDSGLVAVFGAPVFGTSVFEDVPSLAFKD